MAEKSIQRSQSTVLVSLTQEAAGYKNAPTAVSKGKVMATAPEALLSWEFTDANENVLRKSWVFVSYENAPTETGYHKIDFKNNRLIKITEEEAAQLEWYEKVFVHKSVLKRPLALGVDCGRLVLYANLDRTLAFRVAQCGADVHETEKQQQAIALLRVDQGKAVVLTSPSGEKTTINVTEGTIVSLE